MKQIFGYEWEDIRRAQQGGRLGKPIIETKRASATEADRKLLAMHGIEGLREMSLFGVLDRLSLTEEP